MFCYEVKELTVTAVFHYQTYSLIGFDNLLKFHYMTVASKFLQRLDFQQYFSLKFLIQLSLVNDLDSNSLLIDIVNAD